MKLECSTSVCMFMNYSYTFLFVFQVDMATFSPYRACQHNVRMVYLNDHGFVYYYYYSHIFPDSRAQHCNYATLLAGRIGYDAVGEIIKEILTRGISYVYLVSDFSLGYLHEDEQSPHPIRDADSPHGWLGGVHLWASRERNNIVNSHSSDPCYTV